MAHPGKWLNPVLQKHQVRDLCYGPVNGILQPLLLVTDHAYVKNTGATLVVPVILVKAMLSVGKSQTS